MALFECCSKQFVKDTGRSTLHPVVDLISSSRCNIPCIVVKKKSRWFWKSVKYEPTPWTLNEILTKVSCQIYLSLKNFLIFLKIQVSFWKQIQKSTLPQERLLYWLSEYWISSTNLMKERAWPIFKSFIKLIETLQGVKKNYEQYFVLYFSFLLFICNII